MSPPRPCRILSAAILLACLGAGCSRTSADRDKHVAVPTRTGIAQVAEALDVEGHPMELADPTNRWTLSTLLPPTFTDGHGTYAGATDGESIAVQLGVGGTLDEDLSLMRKQAGLASFEDGTIGAWSVIIAHDAKGGRWVVRARMKDATEPDRAYHVIECLSAPHSNRGFWDGCRTFILHATVGRTKPAP